MKLTHLQFITDENIDTEVKEFLLEKGFVVLDIKNSLLFGLADESILEMGYNQKKVIITQDSDFGTLIYRDNKPFYGIIYLRPGHASPNIHVETIDAILKADMNIEPAFLIIAENNQSSIKIRFRQFEDLG